MCAVAEKIHLFEQAGLGKAPFRCVGLETSDDRAFINRERESNGLCYTTNNATTCDYCGQGIMNAYQVVSADGKRFKVGCDCMEKTGDAGLRQFVKDEERAKRQKKAAAKREAYNARERAAIEAFQNGLCESLKDRPHPKGRQDATAYDYAAWIVQNRAFMGETFVRLVESVTLQGCPKP